MAPISSEERIMTARLGMDAGLHGDAEPTALPSQYPCFGLARLN